MLVLAISAPAVLAAFIVGLIVSLFQAATQIQEHTLPVIPKLLAAYTAIAIAGVWILKQLSTFAIQLFQAIADVAK